MLNSEDVMHQLVLPLLSAYNTTVTTYRKKWQQLTSNIVLEKLITQKTNIKQQAGKIKINVKNANFYMANELCPFTQVNLRKMGKQRKGRHNRNKVPLHLLPLMIEKTRTAYTNKID